MKLVNITDQTGMRYKVNTKYVGVPQPMYIYHSTEELFDNVKEPIIVKNIFEFYNFASKNYTDVDNDSKNKEKSIWYNCYDKNVWVGTNEKLIPDTMDEYGNITYKLGTDNLPIKTDNCYIRLNSFLVLSHQYMLFLSSGVEGVSLGTWKVSAATKTQFLTTTKVANAQKYKPYSEQIGKILARKQVIVKDMQFLMLLINPLSEIFLDVDACFRKVFPTLRVKDRQKYLNTERFRKLFITQLGRLMPDLIKGVQQHNAPEDIGLYIKKMREAALERGSTQDQIEALNVALKIGYADKIVYSGNDMSMLENNKFVPLISNRGDLDKADEKGLRANRKMIEDDAKDEDEVKAPPQNTNEIKEYNDEDIGMNKEVGTSLEYETGGILEFVKADYDKAMNETGAIDGFIIKDSLSNEER